MTGTDEDLNAATLIERNLAEPEDFAGLTTKQAEVVVQQVWRILNETKDEKKATMVVKGLADGMRKAVGLPLRAKAGHRPEVTITSAKFHADVMIGNQFKDKIKGKLKVLPDINKFIADFTRNLADNSPTPAQKQKLEAIIANRAHMSDESRRGLTLALRSVSRRWLALADRVEVK